MHDTPMKIATACLAAVLAGAAVPPTDPMTNDIVASYDWVQPQADYIRRTVMIPMRDGTELFTVIVMRKGTSGGPMLLTRTPYNADKATSRNRSQKIEEILPVMDREFVNDGYIRVYQDVRGLHGSKGDYVMNRPLAGPLNKTGIDHATDAYDTIDWLVKNVPESNGRVGIIGSSYPGFTALMATIDPHPALKAAVPQSPMVDGWIGDDWFHNGAFRQPSFDYIVQQTAKKGNGPVPYGTGDDFDVYLAAGSAGAIAQQFGVDQFPAARKLLEHPAYDVFWQEQAVDKLLGKRPLTVPTMLVVGQWDQEDSYGAPAVYKALEAKDTGNDKLFLVIGPWRHSGVNYDGSKLGALDFTGDTGLEFRTRCDEAIPRSASEDRRSEGRHAAGADLCHRRRKMGHRPTLAGRQAGAALPGRQPGPRLHTARGLPGATAMSPTLPSRCRSCRGRCICGNVTSGRPGSSPISVLSPGAPTSSPTRRRRSTSRCTSPARRWSTSGRRPAAATATGW